MIPEVTDPLVGKTVAERYAVQKKLGEGGMGSVYLAQHMILEKPVALKVLHGEFARKPELVERFMQEAKAASRIRHENVIDISDFGMTAEGLVFFAMELLTGHDLHDEIARAKVSGEPLPWARTKKIFLQVCSALAAAHAKGIVHRDLKPENVYLVDFLGDHDFVKLLDFGIAKLTETKNEDGRKLTKTGMLFGTPEYMSPEQARGEPIDRRIDIYALGCLLYHLVAGRVPFEADSFMGVLSMHLTEAPSVIAPETFDRIGAPRALWSVIERALAKDREARWQTMDELAAAVRDADVGVAAAPAPVATALTSLAPARTREPEWKGRVSVPQVAADAAATRPVAPKRSKLPAVLAVLVVLGGGGTAAYYFATQSDDAVGTTTANAPAPAPVQPAASPAAAPAVTAPAAPALPDRVTLVLDSVPSGATVTDLASGKAIGKTPLHYEIAGATAPRQFAFHHSGYGDTTIEVVPNRAEIEYTEKLVKGAAPGEVHRVVIAPVAATPTTPGAVAHPEVEEPQLKPAAGSAAQAPADQKAAEPTSTDKPAEQKPEDKKPEDKKPEDKKPEQKCNEDEGPCLKAFGSGS